MGIYDRDYYQDSQLRPLRPWDNRTMVTLLIFANVAVYVVSFLFSGRSENPLGLMRYLTLRPEDLSDPLQWYRFVTNGFAHDPRNIFHILFNMASLYFLGRNVEDKYGKWEFGRFYLLTLVVCSLVWALVHQGQSVQLLGASGAVTGVVMLFIFSFPQATLMLYGVLPVKAWVLGVIVIVSNVLGSPNDLVAYDVHLVGAGLAALYFYGNWNLSFVGNWYSSMQTRLKQKRRGLKVHRSDAISDNAASKDAAESDRILEKIHREGKDSLTSRERSFMERYSREIREKRQQS